MHSLLPNKSPRDISDRLQWLNSSGQTVPKYGVVKLFSYDTATNQFQADKPDGGPGLYYVNGSVSTASNGYSASAMWSLPQRCLLDASSYGVGDLVGPLQDSWAMGEGGQGFRVLRPPNAGNVGVVQKEAGDVVAAPAIVIDDLGCGYYEVELAEYSGWVPTGGEGTGSGSQGGAACNACESVDNTTIGDPDCGTASVPDFHNQFTGTGIFAIAYDPQSTVVPLQVGTDCVVQHIGWKTLIPGSGSGSGSGLTEEPIFLVTRGYQTHTVQYKNEYECCDGVDTLVKRTAVIFAAKVCEEIVCGECPSGSGSGSGSGV
jgi:hypothetical protein